MSLIRRLFMWAVLAVVAAFVLFCLFMIAWNKIHPASMEDTTAAYQSVEKVLQGWDADAFLRTAGKEYFVDWDGRAASPGMPREAVTALFATAREAAGKMKTFDKVQCVESPGGGLDCFATIGFEKLDIDVTAGLERDGEALNVTSLVLRPRPKGR